jgi:hypothetical protein
MLSKTGNLDKKDGGHIFYHADRYASLRENQTIGLNEKGLSYFGEVYWPIFGNKVVEEMNSAEQREFYLEQIRSESRYKLYASRLQCIFGANSIAEAMLFANSIVPRPKHAIPIIEIITDRFWTLDSNWLDFDNQSEQFKYYRNYWEAKISNHKPEKGERRPPRLEVMIALPATTGKIVHVVELDN